MVKLVDVARACGLSVSQTSRALNGRQDVSEETKRRVSQTAAAMGYVKNLIHLPIRMDMRPWYI